MHARGESTGPNTVAALGPAWLECGGGRRNSWCAVKCVDIRRNTGGEGGLLDRD